MTEVEIKGDGKALLVKNWHVILVLVLQILGLAVAYGRINAQLDETRKDVERIEARPVVTSSEWDSWRQELINRISRIEDKLDNLETGK